MRDKLLRMRARLEMAIDHAITTMDEIDAHLADLEDDETETLCEDEGLVAA